MSVLTTIAAAAPRNRSRARRREALVGWAFVLPSLVGFLVFVLGPLVAALVISFTRYDLITSPEWVGLENFRRLLHDERLHAAYRNTVIYVIAAVVLINGLAVTLAVMVNRKMPALLRTVVRSVYFFPSLVGLAYVSIIWQALLQKDTGIVNYYLTKVGGPRIDWLNDRHGSVASVILVDTWRNVGFTMLVYVSALQEVPRTLLEAAQMDGAGKWRTFRSVTLPMITPAVFFNVVMVMIGSFQIYESIIVLTGGGPGDASRSVVMYLAEEGFQQYRMGYASAIGMTLFVIILVLTLVQFRLRRRWVHFE